MSYGSVNRENGVRPHFTDADIVAGIAEVAREHLGWTGPLSLHMPLVETFNLDSLRQLTLVIEIENRFQVKLDDEDAGSLTTVADLVALIRRNCDRT